MSMNEYIEMETALLDVEAKLKKCHTSSIKFWKNYVKWEVLKQLVFKKSVKTRTKSCDYWMANAWCMFKNNNMGYYFFRCPISMQSFGPTSGGKYI